MRLLKIGNLACLLGAALISLPSYASSASDLGLVLNMSNIKQGFEVVSVKENSLADKLKVKAGDKIIAIHGQVPSEQNKQGIVAGLNQMQPGDIFNARVVSDGYEFEVLSIIPKNDKQSNGESCAYVSLQGVPPKTRDVHRVLVKQVNGRAVNDISRYKLNTGYNSLSVIENIRVQDIRYKLNSERRKHVRVYVEPGEQVYLGAQYLKMRRMETLTGRYWYPTIWKSKKVSCSA